MGLHAKFSPSSAATWLNCSWSARNAVPQEHKPQSTVEAANEGTRVHALLEGWHATGAMPSEDDVAYDAVATWANFIGKLEPGTLHAERRVTISDDCWGTADLNNEHPRIETIGDYKNGKWDVSAYHNAQMLTYGAARLDDSKADWFRFFIFQPNGLEASDHGFKQWVASRSIVEGHKAKVLEALKDDSPPKPGPHCRWCKAFHVCPAMSSDAGFLMGAISRDPADLTPEETVRLLRLIRALGDLKPAYEDRLTTYMRTNDIPVEGAKLKKGIKWRAWNDERQAAKVIAEKHGVEALKPPSVAQAEKLSPELRQYVSVATHKPEGEYRVSY